MPNEVKLLPCPFCGADLIEEPGTEIAYRYWKHPRDGCLMRETVIVDDNEFEQSAIAWNTRPTTVVTDEVVELATDADFERISGLIEHAKKFKPQSCYVSAELFPPLYRIITTAIASVPTVVTGEQPGWQPIESAPRGPRILVFEPGGLGPCVASAGWMNETPDNIVWQVVNDITVQPTHWQPLPEPPAQPGDA